MNRCSWCLSDPLYIAYHDNEWGRPNFDDRYLFAMLCLEGMQAGLSWLTILKKREGYYQAFADFNPHIIAQFDDKDVDRLMQNRDIVRHHGKIIAIIKNAKAYLNITQNHSFSQYLWQLGTPNGHPVINNTSKPIAFNDVSIAMAKQLKKDGFVFLGKTTCYAFMQAVGMVNDHAYDCYLKCQIATPKLC